MIFTADIHIKLSGNKKIDAFEENRVLDLATQLTKKEAFKDEENIILGGDIFDKRYPTIREVGLFLDFIEILKEKYTIYLYAGNHEAIDKNTTTFDYLYLKDKFVLLRNDVVFIDGIECRFVDWNNLDKITDTKGCKVLFSHFRAGVPYVEDEVSPDLVSGLYDLTLLGDIHTHNFIRNNVIYSGSPYTTHFKEASMLDNIVFKLDYKLQLTAVKLDLGNKYKISDKDFSKLSEEEKNKHLYKVVTSNPDYKPEHQNIIEVVYEGERVSSVIETAPVTTAEEIIESYIKEKYQGSELNYFLGLFKGL